MKEFPRRLLELIVFEATLTPSDPGGTLRMLLAASITLVLVGVTSVAAVVVWALWWLFLLLWALLQPPPTALQQIDPSRRVELFEPEPLREEQLLLAEEALYDVQAPAPPSEERAGPEPLSFPNGAPTRRAQDVAVLRILGTVESSNAGLLMALRGSEADFDELFDSELDSALLGSIDGGGVGIAGGGFGDGGMGGSGAGGGGRVGRGGFGSGAAGSGVGRLKRRSDNGPADVATTSATKASSYKTMYGISTKASDHTKCTVQVSKSANSSGEVTAVTGCPKRLHRDASRVVRASLGRVPTGTHTIAVTLAPE